MAQLLVLLNGAVANDGRVRRTVGSLGHRHSVTLVYTDGGPEDAALFPRSVSLVDAPRPPDRRGLVGRCLGLHREFDFLAARALDLGKRFDLVLANDYPCLAPAARVARAHAARLVYDSHELYLETVNQFFPRDAGLPKRVVFRALTALARRRGRGVEAGLVRQADLLLTTNPDYADHFRRVYRPRAVEVVRNCPLLRDHPRTDRLREELGIPAGAGIVLYQGVLGPGRGLRELVLSAAEYAEEAVLVLIGDGMLRPSLEALARERGVGARVLFPGSRPRGELLSYTASADVGTLVLEPLNLSKRFASANKIFDYMACRLPVLATDLPEHRRVVGGEEAGILIADKSPGTIAAAANRLLGDPAERARLGANGRAAFEREFHWEAQEAILVRAVDRLLAGEGSGTG